MPTFEVLCATMHQTDFSKIKEMNINSNVVFANQCDRTAYDELEFDGHIAKMISTQTRGVGKNRNLALMHASADILLFADDDLVYKDDYERIATEAFEHHKNADVIVFNLTYLNKYSKGRKAGRRFKRIRFWNSMRYGTARMAIKRSALEKAALSFSHLYGGGAKYGSGEDSLFIREALRKGLKMYYCPIVIATVKQEKSSWFKGYNDKYFIDKGVLIANAFPLMKSVFVYYFAYGMRKVSTEYDFFKICKLMKQGFEEFNSL